MNENLIKKIIYRSNHRGCKETDILLGDYSIAKVSSFDQKQLDLFQEFLDEDDLEIYNWLLGKVAAPEKYTDWLIPDILQFLSNTELRLK